MATYGKKKRSILPSFTSLRDFRETNSASKPKKEKPKIHGSKSFLTMDSFVGGCRHYQSREDSIEEMASMLLDDTTIHQANTDAQSGGRLSQAAAIEMFDESGGPEKGKDLPQLPKLLFNGDDAWAMRGAPVVTAAGSSNQIRFSGDSDPLGISFQSTNHIGNGFSPVIPRKSSKRRSGQPKSHVTHSEKDGLGLPRYNRFGSYNSNKSFTQFKSDREDLKGRVPSPRTIDIHSQKPCDGMFDINGKVQAMLAATKALKGADSDILPQTLVPFRKRYFVDNRVLAKMKTAINDRLRGRSRKRDSTQEDGLLDESVRKAQDFQDDISASAAALTTIEIRMNEGDNFKKPKIHLLTGHGNVLRKPLAEDGKSLRSRKSIDDPFSVHPESNSNSPMPTSFENRLKDDMSIDERGESALDTASRPEISVQRSMHFRRSSGFTDFDAILSSSPVAQSTPRIRLEPSFGDNGKETLKNVPADSHSVFDFDTDNISDMELDYSAPFGKVSMYSTSATSTEKGSQAKRYSGGAACGYRTKRMKKHPSPSKDELEKLEYAMRNFPRVHFHDETPAFVGPLTPKDANRKLQVSKSRNYLCRGDLRVLNLDLRKTTEAMTSIPTHSGTVISFHATAGCEKVALAGSNHSSGYQTNALVESGSIMDVDELQWDDAAYNIGLRNVV